MTLFQRNDPCGHTDDALGWADGVPDGLAVFNQVLYTATPTSAASGRALSHGQPTRWAGIVVPRQVNRAGVVLASAAVVVFSPKLWRIIGGSKTSDRADGAKKDYLESKRQRPDAE
jgi:hypothetical protein